MHVNIIAEVEYANELQAGGYTCLIHTWSRNKNSRQMRVSIPWI